MLKHFRDLVPGRAQHRPDVDQVAQHQHVPFRIALDMAAVGQHLGRQLTVSRRSAWASAFSQPGEAESAERQPANSTQQGSTLERSGDDPGQVRGLARQTSNTRERKVSSALWQ